MYKLIIGFLFSALLVHSDSFAQNHLNADIFPAAQAGTQKVVIDLPHSKLDRTKKVEIYVGKIAMVDNCNLHSLIGEMNEKVLEGWGINYYEFKSGGQIAGTLKGCPSNERVEKFVVSRSNLLDYNGNVPIVVYIPEGFEVRYKIWQTSEEEFEAKAERKK